MIFTDGFIIEIQVDERRVFGDFVQIADVLVSGQAHAVPVFFLEAQGDIVAQAVASEQQLQVSLEGVAVEIAGTLPTQNMACAFGQHHIVAGFVQPFADFIGIDDFGVAERGGTHLEHFLQQLLLQFHLLHEAGFVVQRGEAVGVCVARDLHFLGGDEFLETLNHFGTVLLEQMNRTSCDTETHLDFVTIFGNQLLEHGVGGQVAPLSQTIGQVAVLVIIKILMMLVDVEKAVRSQAERLADMKMEANIVHNLVFECVIIIY